MAGTRIRWRKGSSPAWRARGEHHGLELPEPTSSPGSGWSCSRRRCPALARVAVLVDPGGLRNHCRPPIDDHEAAARALGLQLQSWRCASPEEFGSAFRGHDAGAAEALLDGGGRPVLTDQRGRLAGPGATQPAADDVPGETGYVEAGGLMSYGPEHP